MQNWMRRLKLWAHLLVGVGSISNLSSRVNFLIYTRVAVFSLPGFLRGWHGLTKGMCKSSTNHVQENFTILWEKKSAEHWNAREERRMQCKRQGKLYERQTAHFFFFFLKGYPWIAVLGLHGSIWDPWIIARREVERKEQLWHPFSTWHCDFITNSLFLK